MSILKQSFTIEKYDRTETQCDDISQLVEQYFHEFRQLFGVAFNYQKTELTKRQAYRVRYLREKEPNRYTVTTTRNVYSRIVDSGLCCTTDYYVDCKFIIRDGFGRVVHPDVIYRAYVDLYGMRKQPRMIYTRFGNYIVRKTPSCDAGAKSFFYPGYNYQYRYKQLLSEVLFSKLNLNAVEDELVESEYDLVVEPKVRKGLNNDTLLYALYWEYPYRGTNKGWKSQSKARKQWAKNLK